MKTGKHRLPLKLSLWWFKHTSTCPVCFCRTMVVDASLPTIFYEKVFGRRLIWARRCKTCAARVRIVRTHRWIKTPNGGKRMLTIPGVIVHSGHALRPLEKLAHAANPRPDLAKERPHISIGADAHMKTYTIEHRIAVRELPVTLASIYFNGHALDLGPEAIQKAKKSSDPGCLVWEGLVNKATFNGIPSRPWPIFSYWGERKVRKALAKARAALKAEGATCSEDFELET